MAEMYRGSFYLCELDKIFSINYSFEYEKIFWFEPRGCTNKTDSVID